MADDTTKDWSRWFRRRAVAIGEPGGAERWIKSTRPPVVVRLQARFPIDMPDPDKAVFHRIVVAHGLRRRVVPEEIRQRQQPDDLHLRQRNRSGRNPGIRRPSVRRSDYDKGLRACRTTTTNIVMALDTITDFVSTTTEKSLHAGSAQMAAR